MSGFRDQKVQCPNCDNLNLWFAEICTSCGTALAGTELEIRRTTGQPTDPQRSRDITKTCRSCGAINVGSGQFCTSCGAALVPTSSVISGRPDGEVKPELTQSERDYRIEVLENELEFSRNEVEKLQEADAKAVRQIVSVWEFIKGVGSLLCTLYIVLYAIHVFNGLGWGTSFGAPINDLVLFIECPTKVQLLWDFVNRGPEFDDFLRASSEAGESLIPWICEAGSLD